MVSTLRTVLTGRLQNRLYVCLLFEKRCTSNWSGAVVNHKESVKRQTGHTWRPFRACVQIAAAR